MRGLVRPGQTRADRETLRREPGVLRTRVRRPRPPVAKGETPMARIVPAPEDHRSILIKESCVWSLIRLARTEEPLVLRRPSEYLLYAGPEDRAPLASDPSAAAGGIRRAGLGVLPGLPPLRPVGTRKAINAIFFHLFSEASRHVSFSSQAGWFWVCGGSCRSSAQRKPTNSRTTAITAVGAALPRSSRCR
jgi:hypothetical protein